MPGILAWFRFVPPSSKTATAKQASVLLKNYATRPDGKTLVGKDLMVHAHDLVSCIDTPLAMPDDQHTPRARIHASTHTAHALHASTHTAHAHAHTYTHTHARAHAHA